MSRNRFWMAIALCVAALAAVAATGCGSDDSSSSTTAAETTETAADDTVSVSTTTSVSPDIDAIETTIKTWMLEGDCSLMTDKFLEEQTFDDNPKSACETFENLFTAPSYGEDDIEIGDVQFENDKATAVVGGGPDGINITAGGEEITSTYHLVFEDGTWKIDSADLN
ncbi:MAG: hypothetical protein U0R51_03775 [Solirubrobacterales bacterium]